MLVWRLDQLHLIVAEGAVATPMDQPILCKFVEDLGIVLLENRLHCDSVSFYCITTL